MQLLDRKAMKRKYDRWGDLKMDFRERVPELRRLEGWYDPMNGAPKFKISCKFNDLLRCSRTLHFKSCFRGAHEGYSQESYARVLNGEHYKQPLYRCLHPDWAIAYVPDKYGDFMGRVFIRWNAEEKRYEFSGLRGNGLSNEDVVAAITKVGLERYAESWGSLSDLGDVYLNY